MKLYTHGTDPEADLLMAQWWLRMRDDGDLAKVFLRSAHTLSGFWDCWRNVDLMLEVDDKGIYIAMWMEYYMGTGILGLYVRPDKRHSIGAIRNVLRLYKYIFDAGLKTVIGITKQETLLPMHERLGYTVLGMVPGIYGGEDGYIVTLTAEDFLAKWGDKIDSADLTLDLDIQPRFVNGAP